MQFSAIEQLDSYRKPRIASFLEIYKKNVMYIMTRQSMLDANKSTSWRSNVASPYTYAFINTLYWYYLDSDISFSVNRRIVQWAMREQEANNEEDKTFGTIEEDISTGINYAIWVDDNRDIMNDIVKTSIIYWTWIWEVTMERDSIELEVMWEFWLERKYLYWSHH
jgi:hypothetical protein